MFVQTTYTGLTTATAPSGHQMAIVVSRTVYKRSHEGRETD